MHAVTFAKPHSLASPARPRDVGRVQRRVMHLPVSAPASSNRTDDGAVTESEDVEVKGVALGVARRGLIANVARVGTVLSYGAVLAGCAHTAYVAASRQQRREETQTQNEGDADVVKITQRLSALALAFTLTSCGPALAGAGEKPPLVIDMPGGCTLEALDLFKDTRAKFSLEVGTGALPEAVLDLKGCDYSGQDLTGKILSGVVATGADFSNAKIVGAEMSRAKAAEVNFNGADMSSTNFYEVNFAGSDLRNVNFDNAILTNARFGKGKNGEWAQLDGVNWDGALLSSSDAQRVCENPTVDDYGKAILGCK